VLESPRKAPGKPPESPRKAAVTAIPELWVSTALVTMAKIKTVRMPPTATDECPEDGVSELLTWLVCQGCKVRCGSGSFITARILTNS
jgi:hypothetical protein